MQSVLVYSVTKKASIITLARSELIWKFYIMNQAIESITRWSLPTHLHGRKRNQGKYSQVNPCRFYLPFFLSLFQHILHFSLLTYTGIPTSSFSYFSFKLSSNLNIFCKRSPQAVTHGEGRKRAIVKKIVESDIFLKLSLTSTVQ